MKKKFVLGLLLVFLGACSSFVNREKQIMDIVSAWHKSSVNSDSVFRRDINDLKVYSTEQDNIVYFVFSNHYGTVPVKMDLDSGSTVGETDEAGFNALDKTKSRILYEENNRTIHSAP